MLTNDRLLTVLDQAVVSLGNFLFVILLSKILLPDDFGLYSVIWMSVISFSALVNAWFSSPLFTIYPSLDTDSADTFLCSLLRQFSIFLIALSSTILISFWVSIRLDVVADKYVLFLISASVSFLGYDFFRKVAILKAKNRKILAIDVLVYTVLIVGCSSIESNNFMLVNVIILSVFSVAAIMMFLTFGGELRKGCFFGSQISSPSDVVVRRLTYSKWISLSSVLQFISGNAVTIFSAILLPLSEIGLLRIAQTLVSVFNPVYVYLENHVKIQFASILRDKGRTALSRKHATFSMYFLAALFLVCILLAALSGEIISSIYPEFETGSLRVYFLMYLCLAFLIGLTYLLRLKLMVCEQTKLVFNSYVISAGTVLLAFYPLVALLGPIGLILVLALSQIAMAIMMWAGTVEGNAVGE